MSAVLRYIPGFITEIEGDLYASKKPLSDKSRPTLLNIVEDKMLEKLDMVKVKINDQFLVV